ncbi:glycoside hydrolase family 3 N-terminal domain-containing protein [Humibacillus sp. DSM 29435]|uniref:glycoside hydrolase family 3 N-terminal domain-containing protein n=1 Tax=Humibacillus sp. DSM 29435 TaxID=1869167 RepID=UPI000AAA4819|nr:glycoside hydrolase family 3 N-terminal domain-containing protein [Humibacillus sp. DSM 29435]
MPDTQPAPTATASPGLGAADLTRDSRDARETEPWRDPRRSLDERTDALLAALTTKEKVGQLGSRWLGNDMHADDPADTAGSTAIDPPEAPDSDAVLNVAPMQDVFAASGTVSLENAAAYGLGHLTRIYGSVPRTAAEGAAEVVRQQHVVIDCSRLGIPAIVHEECLTGFTTYGATVYPAAIAWGATFDPDLVEQMASAIGRDMASLGVHQGLSPVLDVVRDYRWGRVEETMGEDPYLVSMLGSAYVRGLQSAGVVATLKHFAGYSAARAARNHGPVSMGRRELLDVILPPFEMAVRLAGADSVMNSYSDVDGVPAVADAWLLTELLRETWGFTGTVVSDYWAVPFLASMHRVAVDVDDAGAQSLSAGLDVELPDTLGFGQHLADRVARGDLDEQLVDRAARRVLRQKIRLGLLDPGWTPEGSAAGADRVELDSAANRQLARRLAERSVVLLDAGTALPLTGPGRTSPATIAVVGPTAADARTFMGCYAFPNHVLPRYPARGLGVAVPTLVDALASELPEARVTFTQGCAIDDNDRTGFEAALASAQEADLCVVAVGDLAGLFGQGTSGEGCDAADLSLPGVQGELVAALIASGTPVVVVVVSGRPYALGEVAEGAAALVQAFMPGEEGAGALAGILSGRVQPTGKLPVQVPRIAGGGPSTYLQPPLGLGGGGISTLDPTPLFAFGFGSSYTRFEVSDLSLSSDEIDTGGELSVTVRVTNVGDRAGEEVVQLYLHDVVAQVTRPVKSLIGFARVAVEPGESRFVTFRVHADRTGFTGRDLRRVVEPGEIRLWVGSSSDGLPCSATVRLTGPLRVVSAGGVLVTPVEVSAPLRTPQGL